MSKTTHQIPPLLLFLLFIPSASEFSFNMTPITAGRVNISGDAYIDGGGVHIPDRNESAGNGTSTTKAGQAILRTPLQLWDKSSSSMIDFTTHFTFAIASVNGSASFADGMAFFLAPPNSTVSRRRPAGERLGLGDSFVAVEFDTFLNGVDPQYDDPDKPFPHVGIDVNSTISANTTPWRNNITQGNEVEAWIRYDAVSKTLMVNFTGRNNSVTQRGSLSHVVDLRDYLPEYVSIGFSASTGLLLEKHNIRSWSFSSNLVFIPEKKQKKKGLVFGLAIGLSVLVLVLAFAVFIVWKKKKKQGLEEEEFSDDSSSSIGSDFEQGTGPRKFTYNELVLATNNFNEQQKLGEGGFGAVYKGFLRSTNTHIAVKRVSKGSKQGRKEYASEIKIITQLRHMNLVHLMGWCHRRSDLLLVYEFMPNKSLDTHLFKPNSLLTWEMRYRIAQGLASALVYLHEELRHYVVHRDIKSSNIMLDANFNAKLGDFGLARLVDPEKDPLTTVPAGTIGYMAPEYLANWRASKETDIYSFGIVLLEIACGRKSIEYKRPQNQILLVDWVWSLYGGGRLLDGVDPKLESSEDDTGKIERLMVAGLCCVHPDSKKRPSIRQVMQILNFEGPLPELPVAKPVAVFDFSDMVTGSLNSITGGVMTGSSSLCSMSDFHPR